MGIAESFFCKKFEVRIYLTNSEIFFNLPQSQRVGAAGYVKHEFSQNWECIKIFIFYYLTNFHLTVNYNALLFRTEVFKNLSNKQRNIFNLPRISRIFTKLRMHKTPYFNVSST